MVYRMSLKYACYIIILMCFFSNVYGYVYTDDVDATNGVSGFIYYNGIFYTTTANSNAYESKTRTTAVERRGFYAWNLSVIPDEAIVTQVRFYHDLSSKSTNTPVNWRSQFYYSTNIGTLDNGDWNTGTSTNLVDWSNYCGGTNGPCDTWITLSISGKSSVLPGIYDSIINGTYFTIRSKDSSLTDATSSSWSFISGVTVRDDCDIEITYSCPCENTYCGGNDYTVDEDEDITCTDENIYLNGNLTVIGNLTLVNTNMTAKKFVRNGFVKGILNSILKIIFW